MLDGFRRLEQHSPVMMLPRLVMTRHLNRILSGAMERLADGHRYQMNMLGADVESNDDGISVQGDTNNFHIGAGAEWLRSLAMLLPLVAAGAALPLVWDWLSADEPAAESQQPSAVVAPPASGYAQPYKLGVVVTDGP